MNKLKIGDMILIVFILYLMIFVTLLNFESGDKVIIEADGDVIKTLDLSEDNQFVYEGRYKNTIIVKNGEVYVSDSNCPDKTCVNSGIINDSGVICCLPNKLVIRIAKTIENVDVISG